MPTFQAFAFKSPSYYRYYHCYHFIFVILIVIICLKINVIIIILLLSLLFFVELVRSAMWTLDLCELVLPKLKGFISTQHHSRYDINWILYLILVIILFSFPFAGFFYYIRMNCILIRLLKKRASSQSSFFITTLHFGRKSEHEIKLNFVRFH